MLDKQPANRPAPGTALVADKGFAGQDFEEFLAGGDLGLTLIRRSHSGTPIMRTAAGQISG